MQKKLLLKILFKVNIIYIYMKTLKIENLKNLELMKLEVISLIYMKIKIKKL